MSRIYNINNHLMEYNDSCINYKVNYNPLNLPPYTIRVKFPTGFTPETGDTRTLVDADENIWDLRRPNISWQNFFYGKHGCLLKVLGANTTNVEDMTGLFGGCSALTTVPLFDTSDSTNFNGMFSNCKALTSVPLFDTYNANTIGNMFYNCSALKYIPLFDTTNVVNIGAAFYNCTNVEGGALALYQQASTQANPTRYHSQTFYNCGVNTVQGAAELAQIPSDWK